MKKMDQTIENLFCKLFTLAESVKPNREQQPTVENPLVVQPTIESDGPPIKTDQEMLEVFNKMTKRAEKLIKRARDHNRRLPEEAVINDKRTDQQEVILFETTKAMGPVKRYLHEAAPKKNPERKFKKRGGKRRRESLLAKRWKKLAETMENDGYCDTLMRKARVENNYKKKNNKK